MRASRLLRRSVAVAVLALVTLAFSVSSAAAFTRILRYGDTGRDVKCWQTAYNAWNLRARATNQLTVDGVFGANTRYATERFQGAYPPLQIDGEVGDQTAQAMSDALQDEEAYGTTTQANAAYNAFAYCGTMLPG